MGGRQATTSGRESALGLVSLSLHHVLLLRLCYYIDGSETVLDWSQSKGGRSGKRENLAACIRRLVAHLIAISTSAVNVPSTVVLSALFPLHLTNISMMSQIEALEDTNGSLGTLEQAAVEDESEDPSSPPLRTPLPPPPTSESPLDPSPTSPSFSITRLIKTQLGRRTLILIGSLILANILGWAAALGVATTHSALLSGALLAWTLGLRHAIDADHIAAIDGIVRWLVELGEKPVLVGLFFSLGHSTIVLCATIALAALLWKLQEATEEFENAERWLGIVGSSVSAVFLFAISAGNAYAMVKIWKMKPPGADAHENDDLKGKERESSDSVAFDIPKTEEDEESVEKSTPSISLAGRDNSPRLSNDGSKDEDIKSSSKSMELAANMAIEPPSSAPTPTGGPCFRLALSPLLKLVNHSWKAFPLGLLFGLGFDTAIQVVLLATSAARSLPAGEPWAVILLPILFACGMALADSLDGIAALYAYLFAIRDPERRRSYNLAITGGSLAVAFGIGCVQVINLVDAIIDAPDGESEFWDGLRRGCRGCGCWWDGLVVCDGSWLVCLEGTSKSEEIEA